MTAPAADQGQACVDCGGAIAGWSWNRGQRRCSDCSAKSHCRSRRKNGLVCSGRATSSGFCPVHDPNVAKRVADGVRKGWAPKAKWTVCARPGCAQKIRYSPSRPRTFCSKDCEALNKVLRTLPERSPTEFGQFVLEDFRASRMTLSAYSKDLWATADPNAVKRWMLGGAPMAASYEPLRRRFGDRLPPIETEDERRPGHMRKLQKRSPYQKGVFKAGSRRARRASGKLYESLAAFHSSTEGRMIHSLFNYFRWRSPKPSVVETRTWAQLTATLQQTTVRSVLQAWNFYLKARGLWSRSLNTPPPARAGRRWTVPGSKSGQIEQLYRQGWKRKELVEEGARREPGWSEVDVDTTLSRHRRRQTNLTS